MYNMNFIDGLITKEKYGSAVVRFLKICNFFVHLGIVFIFIMVFLTKMDIDNYNRKIENTKAEIETKRTTNKIDEIEKTWETYYYKLLSIKTQVDGHTSYAYVFRDLGLYLPTDNHIVDITCFKAGASTVNMTIDKEQLKKLTSFYDYAPFLNSAFEKSSYLGHEVVITNLEDEKIQKVEIKKLTVSVPVRVKKFEVKKNIEEEQEGSDNNE